MRNVFVKVIAEKRGDVLTITDADISPLDKTANELKWSGEISEIRVEVGESRFNLLLGEKKT